MESFPSRLFYVLPFNRWPNVIGGCLFGGKRTASGVVGAVVRSIE